MYTGHKILALDNLSFPQGAIVVIFKSPIPFLHSGQKSLDLDFLLCRPDRSAWRRGGIE